jgi:hypothetical protein
MSLRNSLFVLRSSLREDLRTRLFYLREGVVQPRSPGGKEDQLIKQIVLQNVQIRPCWVFSNPLRYHSQIGKTRFQVIRVLSVVHRQVFYWAQQRTAETFEIALRRRARQVQSVIPPRRLQEKLTASYLFLALPAWIPRQQDGASSPLRRSPRRGPSARALYELS